VDKRTLEDRPVKTEAPEKEVKNCPSEEKHYGNLLLIPSSFRCQTFIGLLTDRPSNARARLSDGLLDFRKLLLIPVDAYRMMRSIDTYSIVSSSLCEPFSV